jgi:hypothetical protein
VRALAKRLNRIEAFLGDDLKEFHDKQFASIEQTAAGGDG